MTAQQSNRKTGHRRRRAREARRLLRDRRILGKLRLMISQAEYAHAQYGEPIEALSVFYGKEDRPQTWELTPFPMRTQVNGKPMPQWKDLSQWMKVTMATMVCHEWDLLTFNINLHPTLEKKLVKEGSVRQGLAERVRRHLSRAIGPGREYFFVIEGHSAGTGLPTFIHMHGAIAAYDHGDDATIKDALGKAAGHDVHGNKRIARAIHSRWFEKLRAAYPDYLFKFTLKRDPRLDERRLVMSRPMTQAAEIFWDDISGRC